MVANQENILIGILIVTVGLWTMFWKGVALWRAAKYEQRNWFIAFLALMLFINTVGIIELLYLFKFSKKPLTITEVKGWLSGDFPSFKKKQK